MVSEISCQNSTLSFTIVCYFLLCCHSLWCKNMVRDLKSEVCTYGTYVPFWVMHRCWESQRAVNSNDILWQLSCFRKKYDNSLTSFCTFDIVWMKMIQFIYNICKLINCTMHSKIDQFTNASLANVLKINWAISIKAISKVQNDLMGFSYFFLKQNVATSTYTFSSRISVSMDSAHLKYVVA